MPEPNKTITPGAAGTALAVIARGQKVFNAMPPRRRTGLMAAGIMMLAVIAGMAWYLNRPDWRVLF